MALTENQKKANRLGITWNQDTSDEKLQELISAEEKKIEAEIEERRIAKENEKAALEAKKKSSIILKNIDGKDVAEKDYFFPGKDKDGNITYALPYFNSVCGLPVDREDMIEVFKKVFGAAASEFLFYKCKNQEVYIVIVPLSRATVVGESEDSLGGDFQKHAISFISEGSVNLETLKLKLRKISGFLKRSE